MIGEVTKHRVITTSCISLNRKVWDHVMSSLYLTVSLLTCKTSSSYFPDKKKSNRSRTVSAVLGNRTVNTVHFNRNVGISAHIERFIAAYIKNESIIEIC